MAHVLNDAETLRQQRRDEATIEYGRIIQRYDAPEPGDAARLLELMDALGITRHQCALHIGGLEECRHLRRQIERLYGEQSAIRETIEMARGAAAETTAFKNPMWANRPERNAINNKLASMEADLSTYPNRIATMRGQLDAKMRGLPMVYTPAEIQAA